MRIVCFYGVGKATERVYVYKGDTEGRPYVMVICVSDARRNASGGVVKAEGDGTVTLMSLGFHCARLCREKVRNPAGIGVTTNELLHTTGGCCRCGRMEGVQIMLTSWGIPRWYRGGEGRKQEQARYEATKIKGLGQVRILTLSGGVDWLVGGLIRKY